MVLAIGSEVDVVAPLSADRTPAVRRAGAARSVRDDRAARRDHPRHRRGAGGEGTARARAALRRGRSLQPGDGRRGARPGPARRRHDLPVALGAARPPLFAELATLTGGRSFHTRDPAKLTETLRAIARELREQYLLGYTPARPIVAGSNEWRSIAVTVKRPGAQVRARDGYLVK